MQKSCTKTVKYEGKGTERKCDKPIKGENALSFIKLSILNYRIASKIINAYNFFLLFFTSQTSPKSNNSLEIETFISIVTMFVYSNYFIKIRLKGIHFKISSLRLSYPGFLNP